MTQQIFDAHLHIVDPAHPLIPNEGFTPDPFTVADYRERIAGLPIAGGAVVSGSFQGFDQGYLIAALEALGPGWAGVTQLPEDVDEETVLALDAVGVRAVRFNLRRGGSAGLESLDRLARRVHEVAGWHAELYVDARELDELEDLVAALPQASVDHLGLHADGLPVLLRLAERGVKIKATGFGRIDLDPGPAMARIAQANPQALMVGTDLPSTRARRPFADEDLDLVSEVLGEEDARAALWGNAAALYLRD